MNTVDKPLDDSMLVNRPSKLRWHLVCMSPLSIAYNIVFVPRTALMTFQEAEDRGSRPRLKIVDFCVLTTGMRMKLRLTVPETLLVCMGDQSAKEPCAGDWLLHPWRTAILLDVLC